MFSNGKQNIPEVFCRIMENDNEIAGLMENIIVANDQKFHLNEEAWKRMKERWELRKDLMRAAERILKWNTDKGNVRMKLAQKILFLDIDGVLNSDETKERFQGFTGVDRALLGKLLAWRRRFPEVSVVLSSAWRKYPAHKHHLEELGLFWIDQTNDMFRARRGWEISEWLGRHPEVSRYAILDDMGPEEFHDHAYHFVRTNHVIGVTDNDLLKVTHILDLD